jgi:hypothetical protein
MVLLNLTTKKRVKEGVGGGGNVGELVELKQ